ncbi:hypothetical protein KA005_56380 [bacterium]|nr:hypothetical protein [bacterium]
MNLTLFKKLVDGSGLKQEPSEWRLFLEFCSMYLKNKRIKNPVVVELGTGDGKQKEFWKQLFKAEYISLDIARTLYADDIQGDPHNFKTLEKLKKYFKREKPIDILFINASHVYEDVKKDYEMYSPLCDGIVALQGIETFRNTGRKSAQVWKFWDEIKGGAYAGPIVTIFKRRSRGCQRGIGVILKK